MLPKSPTYIYCNFNWCYTSKNYSSFIATWMMSILHFAVQKCPQAHILESGLNLLEGWVQKLSTELSKFFLQFLFWKAVQLCYAVLSLGDLLLGKHCLRLSHFYPFHSFSQTEVLQHFRCPQGSPTLIIYMSEILRP